jgi:hypothetical protein
MKTTLTYQEKLHASEVADDLMFMFTPLGVYFTGGDPTNVRPDPFEAAKEELAALYHSEPNANDAFFAYALFCIIDREKRCKNDETQTDQ